MLYYTNALKPFEEQNDPNKSVGGFVSNSPVPNDFFNNIFSEISMLTQRERKPETYCVAFFNESQEPIFDVTFKFFVEEDALGVISLGFEAPTVDNCGNVFFEKIPNTSARPVKTKLNVVEDGDQFIIPQIEARSYIGIWLRRDISKENSKQLSCEQLNENFENKIEIATQEQVNIIISWDDEQSISTSVSESNSTSVSDSES